MKTDEELSGFYRVLVKEFSRKYGWGPQELERRDGFHRNHRRFIACLLEEEPGRVVGTGMLAKNSWKGKHSLSRIAVEEGFRLRGAGPAMRERMEGEARKMGLKEVIAFC